METKITAEQKNKAYMNLLQLEKAKLKLEVTTTKIKAYFIPTS